MVWHFLRICLLKMPCGKLRKWLVWAPKFERFHGGACLPHGLEPPHVENTIYSYFEKMCTWNSRKVIWDMINTVAVEPTFEAGHCKTQTADCCFHHANEYVTTIVPLFSSTKNNSQQSVRGLHFTLPFLTLSFSTRKHSSMSFPAILSNFFEEQWTQIKPPTILFGIVACSFCDNLSRNSSLYTWTCFLQVRGWTSGAELHLINLCRVAPFPPLPPAKLDPLSLTIRPDMMKIILCLKLFFYRWIYALPTA